MTDEMDEAFVPIITQVSELANSLSVEDGKRFADALAKCAGYHQRFFALAPNQLEHMFGNGMSPESQKSLEKAKFQSEARFKDKLEEYARSEYMRECAWQKYLHEGGNPPRLPDETKKSD